MTEINSGNVLFVGLGADGGFDVDICRTLGGAVVDLQYIKAKLKVLSGYLYIGAGE